MRKSTDGRLPGTRLRPRARSLLSGRVASQTTRSNPDRLSRATPSAAPLAVSTGSPSLPCPGELLDISGLARHAENARDALL
ncbi:hypothetical protein [Streptomyces europaeiscabiei]|uniref:hypothetical protein n=1 Tax=Streptomyces europaeiscabiei TaxID=146819 RepID=UPI000B059443|nr:hypothetical protein [Streptomyces europaeiscabiei]MDX2770544.1 hypothetical protein [Streptomyces europaeiscabiei]